MNFKNLATKIMEVLSLILLTLSIVLIIVFAVKQSNADEKYKKDLNSKYDYISKYAEHKDYSLQIGLGFGGIGTALLMLLICEISENIIEIGKGIQWYNNAYYQEQMQKYQQNVQYQTSASYQAGMQNQAPAPCQAVQGQAGEQQPVATGNNEIANNR